MSNVIPTDSVEALQVAVRAVESVRLDREVPHEQWAGELASLHAIVNAVTVLSAGYVAQFPRYAEMDGLRLTSARGHANPMSTLLEATGYAQIAVEALQRASTGLASAQANVGRIARVEPDPQEAPGDD